MTSLSRRRHLQLAVLVAVAAAAATLTVRVMRRNAAPEPEPAHEDIDDEAPAGAPQAAPRRNGAALIAVAAVAVAVGTIALIAARPEAPEVPPVARRLPHVIVPERTPPPTPSPSPTPSATGPARPECNLRSPWAPSRLSPAASGAPLPPVNEIGRPPCQVAVLGETLTLAAHGGQLVEVTATRALDPYIEPSQQPRPDGRHRLSFRLNIETVAGANLRLWTWGADETAGWIDPSARTADDLHLEAGGEADTFVAFDVRPNARLSRLRLVIDAANSMGVADWVIG